MNNKAGGPAMPEGLALVIMIFLYLFNPSR